MKGVGNVLILIVFLLVLTINIQSSSAAPIANCTIINSADTYTLTQDIVNSPNTTCIDIQASNVIIDCDGHMIDGTDSLSTYGIHTNGYNSIEVKNCLVRDWADGIYLESSNSHNISSTITRSNQGRGIHVTSVTGSIFENVTSDTNIGHGLYLTGSSNNNLTNVNASDGINYGILMDASSDNNIVKDSITNANNVNGLGVESSSGCKIINTTINNNTIHGLQLHYATNTNVTGSTIISNSNQGARLTYSQNCWIKDTVIENSGGNEIYSDASSSMDNYLLNLTFNKSDVSVDNSARLWVKWYLDVLVSDTLSTPIQNAIVNITDTHGTLVSNELTNSSGSVPRKILTEYNQTTSGKFYYTNYTVNVSKLGYSASENYINISSSTLLSATLQEPLPYVSVGTYSSSIEEKTIFQPGSLVRIRAQSTHGLGREHLSNATLIIRDSSDSIVVNNVLMTNVSQITNGYVFEYNYTLPINADGVWTINVVLTDIYENKDSDSSKIAVRNMSMQIKLVLNSTGAKIYIPSSGVGEKTFSTLTPSVYMTPNDFYMASYISNVLSAIVSISESSISTFTEKDASTYALGLNNGFSNSGVLLALTKGNWINIDKRMQLIESQEFLSQISPTFAFGLGNAHPLKIVIEYSNLDINRTQKIGRGYNRIIVEKKGTYQNKAVIDIRRT